MTQEKENKTVGGIGSTLDETAKQTTAAGLKPGEFTTENEYFPAGQEVYTWRKGKNRPVKNKKGQTLKIGISPDLSTIIKMCEEIDINPNNLRLKWATLGTNVKKSVITWRDEK